jgi:flavodoxin
MKSIVLYASKSGNTKKVANVIATELGCQAIQLKQNSKPNINLNEYDMIFIGSGINFGNPYQELTSYIQTAELMTTKKFAVFLTWGGAGLADKAVLNKLRTLLESKEQSVLEASFRCFGGRSFTFMRRGHPNSEDLEAAKSWARKITAIII